MAKLVWDQEGERLYQTGVDHGVIYPFAAGGKTYAQGVAWNGLTSVEESPSGGEVSKIYADNIDYLALTSVEEYGYTIGAYTYPDEFAECDGSKTLSEGVSIGQQPRKHFGFTYRSLIGNDIDGPEHGYKLHLVFNSVAQPSSQSHSTVNDSPEAEELSWECQTTKVAVNKEGFKPTACLVIDSTKVDKAKLKQIEDKLYGTENGEPTMLTPDEVIKILEGTA